MNSQTRSSSDSQFAEKCRTALEKSWGADIPMPKSIGKKQTFKKSYWRP